MQIKWKRKKVFGYITDGLKFSSVYSDEPDEE